MDWPRITIITPSFNQGRYLEQTIRSVLLQSYPNLEYIVMDGGSTDDSPAILERYSDHLTAWVSESDAGQSDALNKGFARSTGEIHAYLNSDDWYEPGALQACAEAYRQGSEWVVGRVRYSRDNGDSWPFPTLPGRSFTRWLLSCPVGQAGSFWSADLHRAAGMFRKDLQYVMDYEMWLRFRFLQGVEPTWLDRTVARYRLHEGSKTIGATGEFGREIRTVIADFESGLSGWQKARLWAARRNRRGVILGRAAVAGFREGEYRRGARKLAAAIRTWPPLIFGSAFVHGMRALGEGAEAEAIDSPFPEMWVE